MGPTQVHALRKFYKSLHFTSTGKIAVRQYTNRCNTDILRQDDYSLEMEF